MKYTSVAMLLLSCLTAGCPDGEPQSSANPTAQACIAGTLSCPCGSGNTCQPTDDGTHLVCDRGFCVPESCPRGTLDCACYDNGSCDPLDGLPMTCDGNVCARTTPPDPGTLGGACDGTTGCTALDNGTTLRCLQGVCAIPGCDFGALGCPCGPYGACEDHEGLALGCLGGTCIRGDCEDGALACACYDDATCDVGLDCDGLLCRSPGQMTFAIYDDRARSCEALVDEGEATVTDVQFATEVRGQYYRRHPYVGIAFIPWEDTPFPESAVSLFWDNNPFASESRPQVTQITCYDVLGHPLVDPQIEVLE